MKKKDLVDTILAIYPIVAGRTNPARGLVSRLIGLGLNDIFFEIFRQEPAFINNYLKRFTVTPVRYDDFTSIATLPTSTLQFPTINDSVRINFLGEQSFSFVPVRMNEYMLTENINIGDEPYQYEVKGSEVWVYGLTRLVPLVIEAIPSFETLSDNDEIKIPAGQSLKLVQSVKELFGFSIGK